MAGGLKNTLDKVTDTVGGAAGQMSAVMTKTADSFVENATISDLYERTAARTALRRSADPQVQMVARQMLSDHYTSTHQLQAALEMNETRGVAIPQEALDTRRETMVTHLNEAPDDAFDKTYLDQQVLAHEEAVSLMRSYRDGGDNPQLRSFAAGTAPVVERHLKHMKMLREAL